MTYPVMEQWVIYDHPRDFPDHFPYRIPRQAGDDPVIVEVWI